MDVQNLLHPCSPECHWINFVILTIAEVFIHIISFLSRCCTVQKKMAVFGDYGGYCAIIGGILIHLTLGNLYSFGEFCKMTLNMLFLFIWCQSLSINSILYCMLSPFSSNNTFFCAGNMMTYMTSYMHQRVSEHVTYSNTIWIIAITTAAQGFFMVLGGLLEKCIGPRLTCLIGSILYR